MRSKPGAVFFFFSNSIIKVENGFKELERGDNISDEKLKVGGGLTV